MKKSTFTKFGCGVMIGLIAPLTTVNAADANDYIQAQIGGDGVGRAYESQSWSASQGAQGPIRSDFMDDHAALSSANYAYPEDGPAYRFAYPEEGSALSETSRGADGP